MPAVVFTVNNKSLSKAHAASPFSVFFPLTYNERSNYSLRARRFTEGEKAGLNSAMRHFVRAIKTRDQLGNIKRERERARARRMEGDDARKDVKKRASFSRFATVVA